MLGGPEGIRTTLMMIALSHFSIIDWLTFYNYIPLAYTYNKDKVADA